MFYLDSGQKCMLITTLVLMKVHNTTHSALLNGLHHHLVAVVTTDRLQSRRRGVSSIGFLCGGDRSSQVMSKNCLVQVCKPLGQKWIK